MTSDLDIYRTASVLIREHGEDAALEAAMRAIGEVPGDLGGRETDAPPRERTLHYLTVELLERSYFALKRNAAPGTDGATGPHTATLVFCRRCADHAHVRWFGRSYALVGLDPAWFLIIKITC